MAKIWPTSEGEHAPWTEIEIPLSEAIRLFELQQHDFESDLARTPGFAEHSARLWPAEPDMIVEVERKEGEQARWRPGLYRSRILLHEARIRLIRHALVSELGADNVVRIESQTTSDTQGRDALKVTIVIAPGATQHVNDRALDASVALRHRLHAMGDDRFPIVEYATEAELTEDGHPQS